MTNTEYLVVETTLVNTLEERLAELVGAHSALGANLVPVAVDRLRATIYLDRNRLGEVSALLADLEKLGGECLSVSVEPARDWLAAYRARARPFEVGKTWWVEPDPELRDAAPPGRRRLVVEPRMAFGTGSHESTHLVLLELEEDPPVGERFLDVGAGSGILTLAAQCLGAVWTVGLDIDLQAVFVARQIARNQDFVCQARFLAGPIVSIGDASFDRVVCNMVASQFMPLAEEIRRVLAPAGTVIFSGILQSEETEVHHLLEERGLAIQRTRYLGEWVSLRAGHA